VKKVVGEELFVGRSDVLRYLLYLDLGCLFVKGVLRMAGLPLEALFSCELLEKRHGSEKTMYLHFALHAVDH